jgi:hypothetical protein
MKNPKINSKFKVEIQFLANKYNHMRKDKARGLFSLLFFEHDDVVICVYLKAVGMVER